ncbi:hypothetical protein C5167_033143 [Papaver somniferum]|uniref:Small ribosomal subunit protein eS4 N-terminal domain-containing protein n=1 Tax=Papaver somniferum TaxID=3469 RepID=A0A4Y7KAX0_PAPSO|nr:hypothetical protein C5167_033143 [Papaver somniferum]
MFELLDEEAYDMDDVVGCFEYYAELVGGLDAKHKVPVNIPMEKFKNHVRWEPIGIDKKLVMKERYGGGMSTAKSALESDTVVCSFLVSLDKFRNNERGLKKHLKRLNALKHWMIVKLGGSIQCVKIRVIQTPLFVSGISIFLQVLFGTRLPAVIGGSSADTVPILCIIRDSSLQRITEPHERFLHSMMETQGVLIVAASLQIILGFSLVVHI